MEAMKQYLKSIQSERVEIVVGQGDASRKFAQPKDLLCAKSEWFNNALKDQRFLEGQNQCINLPDDDPDVFEAFAYFAYRGSLEFMVMKDLLDLAARVTQLLLMFKIWVFGDKYLLPKMQNAAMHRICVLISDAEHNTTLPMSTVAELFETAKDHAQLRLVIADHLVQKMRNEGIENVPDEDFQSSVSLLRALHASETALHDLPQPDFPRYNKPTKFSNILYVGPPQERLQFEHSSPWDHEWRIHNGTCQDCGYDYYKRIQIVCRRCDSKYCTCHLQDFAMLCIDCRSTQA